MVGGVVWFPCVGLTLLGREDLLLLGRVLFGPLLRKDRGSHLLLVGKTPSWPSRELRPRETKTDSLLTPINGELGAWNGRARSLEMGGLAF